MITELILTFILSVLLAVVIAFGMGAFAFVVLPALVDRVKGIR